MLAVEHPHLQHHHHFAQPFGFDSSFDDSGPDFNMNSYSSFDSVPSFGPLPYPTFDHPSFYVDTPPESFQSEMHRSSSLNGSLKPSSHHSSELPPSTLSSSASGHSIPSAPSSTIGSPYSGHAHPFSHHESWINPNEGLGLGSTLVNQEAFYQDFVGTDLDSELAFGSHDKLSDDFVGECANVSSSRKRSDRLFPGKFSQSPMPSQPSMVPTPSPEPLTIDSILERANSSSTAPSPRSLDSSHVASIDKPTTQSLTSTNQFISPAAPASAGPRVPKIATTSSLAVSLPADHPSARTGQPHMPDAPTPIRPQGGQFQNHFFAQSSGSFMPPLESSYPSLIQAPRTSLIDSSTIYAENASYPPTSSSYQAVSSAGSPAPSLPEHAYPQYQTSHMSPSFSPAITYGQFPQHADYVNRRSSISSFHSNHSHGSPMSGSAELDDEGNQKGRCPNPDCGRVFKDLKAHMLTHQSERPEKCPISNCEYNQKGFARKYDKNRHTLTHYKGTMVCGFCPGSGSAAEKSFNRADVFKRHLTSVHGVEQAPPNSRKRSPTASTRRLTSYCEDATGKCSTCSATFTNAQEFYEHLDDCVLRVVQQEEPSEAHNQRHLAGVAGDNNVKDTMERHLLTDDSTVMGDDDLEDDEDEDDDDDDDEDPSFAGRSGKGLIKAKKAGTGARAVIGSCVSKPGRAGRKGLTYSKGGVPLVGRGRKKRKNYPPSWGMSADKMQMKKRVLCVYDGERRLWKDDMMMHNEFEVRMKLADGKSYVTDLDVETLKRAQAFHGASEAEKGPWAEYEARGFDHDKLEKLMS